MIVLSVFYYFLSNTSLLCSVFKLPELSTVCIVVALLEVARYSFDKPCETLARVTGCEYVKFASVPHGLFEQSGPVLTYRRLLLIFTAVLRKLLV